MSPQEKIFILFATIGFVVGMIPGFIIGVGYAARQFHLQRTVSR